MDYIISQLPLVLILCTGIFVQSAAGFAAGLLIVPALLWCGYGIPEAQCSLLVATIPQNVWGVWDLRGHVTTREIAWPGVGRILFLPLGALTLKAMESLDETAIRQVVGGVVLTATIAIMLFRPHPQKRLRPFWTVIAFPVSGFFQGLVGMGGPAMVFWVQAHDWETRRMRAFMFSMYLISIGPAIGILYWVFGPRIVQPGLIAVLMFPLLWLVTLFGIRFGTWLGRIRLRRVSLGLLLLMGIAGLAAPLIAPG
jgi:uncharacterized membrane protein YfcA